MAQKELNNLDWLEILRVLESFGTSELTREHLRQLAPLANAEQAQDSFEKINEAQKLLQLGQRPFMESLDLFAIWFSRLSKEATLKTIELKDVRLYCMECIALREVLREADSDWTSSQYKKLFDASEPLSAIDQLMTADGEIRSDASEQLYKLFQEKKSLSKQVQNVLDRLVRQNELDPILQERFVTTREGRWVLPVKGGMQHQFEGIIHGSSHSKQTVFMEPTEIVPINNRLRDVESEIEEEIERLLAELSRYLRTRLKDFETAKAILIDFDQLFAKAQLAIKVKGEPCTFVESEVHLLSVRHPLLSTDPEVKVIPNSVTLDAEKRILLLSGPNAGGKTVLLKSIGLAAQMARCGLFICAEAESRLPFFREIFVSIGDAQSIDSHLSTFAAHLKILSTSLKARGPQALLLIDEICGSTDPEEGTALARSFIEAYGKNLVFGIVTSHLGPLKTGWTPASGVCNGSLEYDSKTGRPTYQFLMGIPGQSLALQTASRVGVEPAIVERALQFLSPETKRYHESLKQIEDVREQIQNLKTDLMKEREQVNKDKEKYATLIQKFQTERDKMLEQAKVRAERKIDRMIDNIKVDEVFKKHEALSKVKHELPEVIKATPKSAVEARKIESAEAFAKAFPPGSKVYAPSIGKDAVVQGEPGARGEVPILSASMRLLVPWDQLQPPQSAQNPTLNLVRQSHRAPVPAHDSDRILDVRGMNIEEALTSLEETLDVAVLHDEDRMKIVHGHGTDSLKKNIRNFLSRSTYVQKWQAGSNETGGDGVTWVELK